MKNVLKTRLLTLVIFSFCSFSCSGPTEKPVDQISDEPLPEVADSLTNKPKDGVKVPVDTTSPPEINETLPGREN